MPTWRPAAVSDRQRITAYIAQDNPRAAVAMGDMLFAKALQLDQHPLLGRVGHALGTRELVVHPNYILIYRVNSNAVEILRVKHVAQQSPT